MSTILSNKIFLTLMLVMRTSFITFASILGPDYIYQCPKCENLLKKGSILSGNTYSSFLYSDGKIIAPMLPLFPNLTKCEKCDTILWLSDMKEIGRCGVMSGECTHEWENASRVKFLYIKDLCRFLELDAVKNDIEKEKVVRQMIWWIFNDRERKDNFILGQAIDGNMWKSDTKDINQQIITIELKDLVNEIFMQEFDETLWEQNCQRLLELFDMKDVDQKILTAEIYRNLGEFDMCLKLIDTIDDKDYDWIVNRLKFECENRNKLVIMLK